MPTAYDKSSPLIRQALRILTLLKWFGKAPTPRRRRSTIREIIEASAYLQSHNDLRFRWQRIRNHLNEANIYASLNSIWIRPDRLPTNRKLAFGSVGQAETNRIEADFTGTDCQAATFAGRLVLTKS